MNDNQIDTYLKESGLIDIQSLDPTIVTDIRYATSDNFTGSVLYDKMFGVYAEPELAHRLAEVNAELHRLFPGYNLVIFDAARPLSVQYKMYELVKGTDNERYVALPGGELPGGFHNYGMAVDLSICNENKVLLDMGTDFDSFSPIAHIGNERRLVAEGLITTEAYINRCLLYYLTGRYGLLPYQYEWWHYQFYQDEQDKLKFKLIDF